ncbi:mitochondrial mRNA pseudouridine synthase Trub2-like [Centruroides sculpturatus]|uniref:mitochondrial mRNA pseudouridine synthase Trub2-like n=1 Tax=Centruroides sculpturatus TaxID=218467 RepID=UPI000C6CE4A3|nr:mitochondrial mRNA pseudouridine synthase Trub2-like [Centruroides sculpturatus]XP_023230078.1 mitochondrial mRNA pseudouridine synthase Trub2-like [Centruroides sculpturatus]XP_023230079.1 mitochondrial mRNA pseudouridine synthase Trub2-like [Centruroides sculpturatus]
MKIVTYAPEAWKYLNGIFCIYKPAGLKLEMTKKILLTNLVQDFNELEVRPPRNYVRIEGSVASGKSLSVKVVPNLADHPLVVGPRYQKQDFNLQSAVHHGNNISGIMVMAINDQNKLLDKFRYGNHLKTYHIKGQFGYATESFFADGKIIEKATYEHIKHSDIDRAVSSVQCAHQTHAYKYAGVPLESQTAYELASQGIIRPAGKSVALIYNIRCIHFDIPNFTLEVHCINETELYLAQLVHDLGLYLKSCAVCVQLRKIRHGHFTLDHALLRKHWTLEHILNNIQFCRSLVDKDKLLPSMPYFEKLDESAPKSLVSLEID